MAAVAGFNHQVADVFRPCAPAFGQSHHEVEGGFAVVEFAELLAAEEFGNLLVDVGGGDAFGAGAFAVHLDANLRDGDLGFEVHIGETVDAESRIFHLAAEATQRVEVGPVDLDGDFGRDSAEHVAEAVADRLADIHEGAGNARELFTDVGKDLFARSALGMEFHIEFIHRYRHHMVVAFGSSCAASDRFHLGDF